MVRNIHWRQLLEQPATFVKWLVFAAVSGAVCGGVAAAFYHAFEAVTTLRQAHSWLLFLLPLGGAAIVLLYRWCGMEGDRGTNFVLVAVRGEQAPAPAHRPPGVPLHHPDPSAGRLLRPGGGHPPDRRLYLLPPGPADAPGRQG